jgi:hypothetical protein
VKARVYGSIVSAAVVAGGLFFIPLKHASGQDAAKQAPPAAKGGGRGGGGGRGDNAPTGPTPRMPDGHPDLSGFWQRPYTPDMSAGAVDLNGKQFPLEDPMKRGVAYVPPPPDQQKDAAKGGRGGGRGPTSRLLPFTPAYLKNWQNYDPTNGDYTGACLPFGLIRSINSPDPLQVMQQGTYVAELFEQNTWFHVFHVDGRPHTKGVPTWFGDSVGHWEGDTLVVETNNFNGKTRLDTNGHPHSDAIVVTEKWTRRDLGHIDYEIMIHDPKAFTQDWKNVRVFTLNPAQEIMEYSCEENNKALYEGRIKPPKYDEN